MTNRYILYAGHRDLLVETFFDEPLENEVFCTGVQNIMGNETCSESDHKGLIGSWGRHWPVNDTVKYAKETVGIATYIPQKYIRQEVKIKIISFIPFCTGQRPFPPLHHVYFMQGNFRISYSRSMVCLYARVERRVATPGSD